MWIISREGIFCRRIVMSGHSKWATIKHQKAVKDARRGANFTKFANLISVAARHGGDPETNFRLRDAIDKARKAGVPNANIDRAVKRGSGQDGGAAFEEITYEGYGPGGVAIMVEAATDNRNRTASEVRSSFSKHGGSLGTTGSVAYQFQQRGVIIIPATDLEAATLAAIEAGAEDVEEGEGQLTVYTAPAQLDAVRKALAEADFQAESAELSLEPTNTVRVEDAKTVQTLMRLMDALDEQDDVTNTYTNADFDPEVVAQVA
jgi:YebC/PmpR family DNA-binding regulatory protein